MKESAEDVGAAAKSGTAAAQLSTDWCEAVGAEICMAGPLEPGPQALDRVEIGGVRRKTVDSEPSALGVDVVQGFPTPMGEEPVPDEKHRPSDVATQVLQEADDLGGADGPWMCHQEYARALRREVSAIGQRSNGREVFPVAQPVRQDRRLSTRRPGAADRRAL